MEKINGYDEAQAITGDFEVLNAGIYLRNKRCKRRKKFYRKKNVSNCI